MPKSQISLGMYDKSTNTTSSTNITNTTCSTPMQQVQCFRSHNNKSNQQVQHRYKSDKSKYIHRSDPDPQAGHCATGECSSECSFDAAPD